ncbi:class I adenylate-forming enzyme family protein [Pseudomonas asplenii]|uniref:class I adenylate-forming enzyme family protein n=1 Tax=Pseudomonas asplenii TaxID=53407 RepID=UPI00036D5A4F|nr:AMP-binding protein [Pseudomonas fuscovaginae]
MNIANWLDDAGRRCPRRPALFEGMREVADYGTFAALVRHRAAYLTGEHGIVPGDRIALFMPNCCEYLELLFAIWWVGAVAVPINCKLHPSEASCIIGDAQARLIFTDNGRLFPREALPRGCRELEREDMGTLAPLDSMLPDTPCPRQDDDLAWLFYTSGTTGRPKGVMLSHGNLIATSLCYQLDVDPVAAEDAMVYVGPMSHGSGLFSCIHVRRGARHVVPDSRGFNADELFQLAGRLGPVSVFVAPATLRQMVEQARRQGYGGEGIKTIVYGAAPMYLADLEDALDTFGPRLVQVYGQGESPLISSLSREVIAARSDLDWSRQAASVGRAQTCLELRVLDAGHEPLPCGQLGEIAVRGPTVMGGYWGTDLATRRALVDDWLLTGDVGFIDDSGYLTLTDRARDVIISGDGNVYPREVEEVLAQHPQVFDVCVVGQSDGVRGESVVAFVVPHGGGTLDEASLDAWFIQRMAAFKKPNRYILCSALPRNNVGKVLKTELRQWLKRHVGEPCIP